ncbi:RagB/SusD family nutrient uptake outer membrane protein [Sphingobacterium griseoflavum]|uniref:RagB/SusD family nutrient uptake outer membrane protein n=1 Tax=Sphingobacterium griseoflavum TaxID=1474952 RepID=A0ABQ3HVZ3_9SPHI|nr:RagB/SusD family nutrient uptake outer membrane protein [Sphingobacterium griseoflavum]GHE29887.1 hypothetical protein GCM10017764_11180 [Sphingobacterium griseoflavum]
MNTKRYKFRVLGYLYGLLLFMPTFYSCEKWLDVRPVTEVPEDLLFQNERGFFENLAGMYHEMTEQSLYGTELSMGLLDYLAQHYVGWGSNQRYLDVVGFSRQLDYESTGARDRFINPIWNDMYRIIGNSNNLLNKLEGREQLFAENNYNLVRGQALALRAFLHFDLLRLYAPAKALAGDQRYIPYVKTYGPETTERSTFAETIGQCLSDLNEAQALLGEDRRIFTTNNPSAFLAHTQNKMNYYAVLGLKARIFLYNEQLDSANHYAQRVINNSSANLRLARSADVAAGDKIFYTEQLFALSVVRMPQIFESLFLPPNGNSQSLLLVSNTIGQNVYETITADFRNSTNYFTRQNVGSTMQIVKYQWRDNINPNLSYIRNVLPLIRLSEMYYIAAETSPNTQLGERYLNQIRAARGIVGPGRELSGLTPEQLNEEIRKEYRKEFFGEGQLFFYYKRLRLPGIPMTDNSMMLTPSSFYTFPVPIEELPLR